MKRTFYLLLHLEPTGFRISLSGLILIPFVLGLQFLLLPDDRWNQPIYDTLKTVLTIRQYGVMWVLFSIWMLLQIRLPTKAYTFAVMYSSMWWLFWSLLFTLAALHAHGTFVGAVLFFGMAWWTFAASQTSAHGQVKVNGPRADEFNAD